MAEYEKEGADAPSEREIEQSWYTLKRLGEGVEEALSKLGSKIYDAVETDIGHGDLPALTRHINLVNDIHQMLLDLAILVENDPDKFSKLCLYPSRVEQMRLAL